MLAGELEAQYNRPSCTQICVPICICEARRDDDDDDV